MRHRFRVSLPFHSNEVATRLARLIGFDFFCVFILKRPLTNEKRKRD